MRLFFLPISTRKAILYCERLAHDRNSESRIAKKVTDKANQTWTNWERAESGWKKYLTDFGNKALSRIPMEEWSLKSVPPLSKQTKREILANIEGKETRTSNSSRTRGAEIATRARTEVNVLFPGTFFKEDNVLPRIQQLAKERKPIHRRRFWWSLLGMPIVSPLALIPIVPNVPFFYLVYRAWSHWRALRGAEHLEFLHKHKLLHTKPSPTLDELYAAGLLHPSRGPARDSIPVSRDQIRKVAASLNTTQHQQHQEEQSQLQQNFLSKTDVSPSLSTSSAFSSLKALSPESPTKFPKSISTSISTIKPKHQSQSQPQSSEQQIYPNLREELIKNETTNSCRTPAVEESEDEDKDEEEEEEESSSQQNPSSSSKDTKAEEMEEEATKSDIMLLRRWNGKLLADRLNLPDMEIEIERAVEQVQTAIEQARKERIQRAEMRRVEAEIAAEERRQENWR